MIKENLLLLRSMIKLLSSSSKRVQGVVFRIWGADLANGTDSLKGSAGNAPKTLTGSVLRDLAQMAGVED